jgi:hypothetical protein
MSTDPPHSELLAQAREKLRSPVRRELYWAALGAAALFALCAILFAAAAVLAPPLGHEPAAKVGVE